MSNGLLLQHVKVGYRSRDVLHDVTSEMIPRGVVTSVLGPNGCGKSTLLKALAGLQPARGSMLLDDEPLEAMHAAKRARLVVYLPQSLPPSVHLKAFESVLVAANALLPSGFSKLNQAIFEEVRTLFEQLGIAHLAMRYLDELSGGQKQLVGLAQALIRKPSLLLLDEPLSALDLNYQYHVMALIKEVTEQRNMLTMLVVHDINIAMHHTAHTIMLQQGRLYAQGAPEQIITPDSLAAVYGVRGRVESCSMGKSHAIIDGLTTAIAP